MEQKAAILEDVTLWTMLAEGTEALESDPEAAEQQAYLALKTAPGQQQALQLLVAARRLKGDMAAARVALESMAAESPGIAAIHFELGILVAEAGDHQAAVRFFSRVVELEPAHPMAWGALAAAQLATGDKKRAAGGYRRQFASSVMDLKMLEEVCALDVDQLDLAAKMLREFLNIHPSDLTALRMLGQLHMRVDQCEAAEQAFAHALKLDPAFRSARVDCVMALHQQRKWEEVNRQLDILLEGEPQNPDYHYLKITTLYAMGRIQEAVQYCEDRIRAEPQRPKFRLAHAYALRIAGRQKDCIAAFRGAIALRPSFGEAWWGLANLKTFHFATEDLQTIAAELARDSLGKEDREFLHFALGKALEDGGDYGRAFEHFSRGNACIRAANPYAAEGIAENVQREKRRFTSEVLHARSDLGCPSTAPIFILGLPRSGSTLVEQILASHSAVEGGGELPCINAIVHRLETRHAASDEADGGISGDAYDGEDLLALGEEYLERCKSYRKSSRPFFADKMPNNFHHLGLIFSILPRARIIDVRRHPLACCLSNFKQIFPSRHGPSYDLEDIGRYYTGYEELMAHFDKVLPGRIHRVFYENLVRNPESEIRRLLDYCGLPFEEACLRFYETDRGILTISSEQVRQPVYTDAIGHWRHYEPWLGPLKKALGPVLEAWPAVPDVF